MYYGNGFLGTIKFLNFHNEAAGDFAIIEVTGDFDPVYRSEHVPVDGVLYSPAVGTYVFKDGAVEKANCIVDSTNATSVVQDKISGAFITINYLVSAEILSGESMEGDSGAPVFAGGRLCGIHSSYSEMNHSIYFTPYARIRSAGFSTRVE